MYDHFFMEGIIVVCKMSENAKAQVFSRLPRTLTYHYHYINYHHHYMNYHYHYMKSCQLIIITWNLASCKKTYLVSESPKIMPFTLLKQFWQQCQTCDLDILVTYRRYVAPTLGSISITNNIISYFFMISHYMFWVVTYPNNVFPLIIIGWVDLNAPCGINIRLPSTCPITTTIYTNGSKAFEGWFEVYVV